MQAMSPRASARLERLGQVAHGGRGELVDLVEEDDHRRVAGLDQEVAEQRRSRRRCPPRATAAARRRCGRRAAASGRCPPRCGCASPSTMAVLPDPAGPEQDRVALGLAEQHLDRSRRSRGRGRRSGRACRRLARRDEVAAEPLEGRASTRRARPSSRSSATASSRSTVVAPGDDRLRRPPAAAGRWPCPGSGGWRSSGRRSRAGRRARRRRR